MNLILLLCILTIYIKLTYSATSIAPTLRPTTSKNQLALLFSQPLGDMFENEEDLQNQLTYKLYSETFEDSEDALAIISAIKTGNETYLLTISPDSVPLASEFKVRFPYTEDDVSASGEFFSVSSRRTAVMPYNSQTNKYEPLATMDGSLEVIWSVVGIINQLFNPGSYMYLETKLYREAMDMMKLVNINYEADLVEFYRDNNNKVSGLRLPNVLYLALMGKKTQSIFVRKESFSQVVDDGRVDDLFETSNSKILHFNNYPYFFDNYGTQISVFVLIYALMWLVTLFRFLFKKNPEGKAYKIFHRILITFKWNFLIAHLVGSSQSLAVYFLIQVKDLQEDISLEVLLNMGISGMMVFIVFLVEPIIIFGLVKHVVEWNNAENKQLRKFVDLERKMPYYRVIFEKFKLDSEKRVALTKGLLLRSFFNAVTVVFGSSSPIFSTVPLLISGVMGVVGAAFTRPFRYKYMTILHFFFEGLYLTTILMILLIGIADNGDNYGSRQFYETIIIMCWVIVPFVGLAGMGYELFYGILGLIKGDRSNKITPFQEKNEEADSLNKPGKSEHQDSPDGSMAYQNANTNQSLNDLEKGKPGALGLTPGPSLFRGLGRAALSNENSNAGLLTNVDGASKRAGLLPSMNHSEANEEKKADKADDSGNDDKASEGSSGTSSDDESKGEKSLRLPEIRPISPKFQPNFESKIQKSFLENMANQSKENNALLFPSSKPNLSSFDNGNTPAKNPFLNIDDGFRPDEKPAPKSFQHLSPTQIKVGENNSPSLNEAPNYKFSFDMNGMGQAMKHKSNLDKLSLKLNEKAKEYVEPNYFDL